MDDNIVEDTETFRVTLESLDSSVFVVGIHSTVVSIEDDDGTFNRITLASIIIIWRMSHLNWLGVSGVATTAITLRPLENFINFVGFKYDDNR